MPFNRIKLFPGKKNLLHHKREFFDALMQADQGAIRLLAKNIAYNLRQAAFKVGLREEDAEEIINDALVITITNIREGKMTFMDYSPVAYATGVGKKLIANRMRTQKPAATNTEELQLADDFDAQAYLENKEKEKLVGNLLAQLGENCQQLIRLKFFDQMTMVIVGKSSAMI